MARVRVFQRVRVFGRVRVNGSCLLPISRSTPPKGGS